MTELKKLFIESLYYHQEAEAELAIKCVKKWLESQRPKSVESMDEIVVNDFIDYLVNSELQSNESQPITENKL